MKRIIVLLLMLSLFFLIGCGEDDKGKDLEKDVFESIEKTYETIERSTLDFNELFKGKLENFTLSSSSSNIVLENNVLSALNKGSAKILVEVGDKSVEITIDIKEKKEIKCEDFALYKTEKKELNVELKGIAFADLNAVANDSNISVEKKDGKLLVTGNNVGDSKIILSSGNVVKEVYVEIKEVEINVLNESLSVDILETLDLILDYPKEMIKDEDIEFTIAKQGIFTIEGRKIIPIAEGKSRIKIQAGDIKKTIEVIVTVDPVKIITMLNQEEPIMLKTLKLYGSTIEEQPLMGSVSLYMFDDLNLVEDIIPIYNNPYIGEIATRDIINYLDKKKNTSVDGAPRSGVKMTSISYITYHDTANATSGADARANANWMVNTYSVTTTARSWHYTVDQKQVIHSIPDDEVTFQGDTYEAYTTSIGIETCVNKGANMDKIWHRMGKLCAKLMTKYDIDVNHIKQHYDWMGKECPHTLRANGLYPYAISLVEAELMVKKYLKDYTFEFESLNTEYVDNTGQVIKAPDAEMTVSYRVHITNESGYDETVTLTSKLTPLK